MINLIANVICFPKNLCRPVLSPRAADELPNYVQPELVGRALAMKLAEAERLRGARLRRRPFA